MVIVVVQTFFAGQDKAGQSGLRFVYARMNAKVQIIIDYKLQSVSSSSSHSESVSVYLPWIDFPVELATHKQQKFSQGQLYWSTTTHLAHYHTQTMWEAQVWMDVQLNRARNSPGQTVIVKCQPTSCGFESEMTFTFHLFLNFRAWDNVLTNH